MDELSMNLELCSCMVSDSYDRQDDLVAGDQ